MERQVRSRIGGVEENITTYSVLHRTFCNNKNEGLSDIKNVIRDLFNFSCRNLPLNETVTDLLPILMETEKI